MFKELLGIEPEIPEQSKEQWTEEETLEFAREQLKNWNCIGWSAKINNGKRRLGVASPSTKTIGISKHLIAGSTKDEVRDVVLHEVAHAVDFMERGTSDHGPKWKAVASRVGARPERQQSQYYSLAKPQAKYTVYCPKCGKLGDRHRKMNTMYYCRKCGSEIEFRENY